MKLEANLQIACSVCTSSFCRFWEYFNKAVNTNLYFDYCLCVVQLCLSITIYFKDFTHNIMHIFSKRRLQKYKSIASPKTPLNRNKGKPKSSGLRVRRLNQI